ncbi:hypothetical protein OESDEN_05690 [Oesophagostomum dentatum]|uniref:Uncharacterized protein n=1 Tax=Oesophagostomum dentatum TaxID=61180 RepID=A0A0B1TG43_OESDE|nr:hypothetical protein OESDEN_05690 [Oesophagostomum dentatum]
MIRISAVIRRVVRPLSSVGRGIGGPLCPHSVGIAVVLVLFWSCGYSHASAVDAERMKRFFVLSVIQRSVVF